MTTLAPRQPRGLQLERTSSVGLLRFVTFLAPKLFGLYEFIAWQLGRRLGCRVQIKAGARYEELAEADVAFVCGLPYVEANLSRETVEPLAAPVLHGTRYGNRPIYFSDVIVRRDSPWQTFADLRGRAWAYNEPHSQSGYGITCYALREQGGLHGFFGRVVEAGWHERAVRLVCTSAVDASAIDSHLLAVLLRDEPALAKQLRIIHTLGPSTIQPVVAARHLPASVRQALRQALLALHDDGVGRRVLAGALVRRFVAVTDADYNDIRAMRAATLGNGLGPSTA